MVEILGGVFWKHEKVMLIGGFSQDINYTFTKTFMLISNLFNLYKEVNQRSTSVGST